MVLKNSVCCNSPMAKVTPIGSFSVSQATHCTDLELYVFVAVTAKILHYTLLATLYTTPVYIHTHGLRNKILLHLAELYILAISYL